MTRERPVGWGIESTRYHRPNVLNCDIVTGITRILLVGAYLHPSKLDHLLDLEESLKRFRDYIVLGELNMDLNESRSLRSQRLADLLIEYGLIYLVHHFHQSRRCRNLKNCSQVRQGTVLRSRCEFILITDQRRFEMVGIRDIRNFLSDHFALRARLLRRPTLCHTQYLRGRKSFPLRPPLDK